MSYRKKANIAYISAFVIIIAYILCRVFIITTITVSGPSMIPTFKNGDIVVCKKLYDKNDIKTGDIVVFKHDGSMLIKRVAAAPGEKAVVTDIELSDTMGKDEYFLLGDNSSNSKDSRDFGPVKSDDIKYKYAGIKIHPVVWYSCIVIIIGTIVVVIGILDKKAKREAIEQDILSYYCGKNNTENEINGVGGP